MLCFVADTEELEQTSPINDVEEHSNGEMRVSSTGSSESVYACSSSKGSPNEVINYTLPIFGTGCDCMQEKAVK